MPPFMTMPDFAMLGPAHWATSLRILRKNCNKYKQLSEPHEFYFSQLRLYHPHSVEDMTDWETSFENAKQHMKNLCPLSNM